MTGVFSPRLFPDDASIRRVGEAMLARTLPKAEWTHEAHIATTAWLLIERPDIVPERDLPALIAAYNESQGGVNDDHNGYHETITQCFIVGVRQFLECIDRSAGLCFTVNALLASEQGHRNWPLRFYSRVRLFSVEARRNFVAPDLAPFPVV